MLAAEYHQRCLEQSQQLGDAKGVANCWGNLGHVMFSSRAYEQALTFYGRSFEGFQAVGDRFGEGRALSHMSPC